MHPIAQCLAIHGAHPGRTFTAHPIAHTSQREQTPSLIGIIASRSKPAQIVAAIVIFAILGKTTDWLIEIATAPLLRWQDAFGRQGGAA